VDPDGGRGCMRFSSASMRGSAFLRKVRVDQVTPGRVRARLKERRLNLARHELGMEIKAVTYHAARVEQRDGQWVAEILFDI